jgi:hypothetical protein
MKRIILLIVVVILAYWVLARHRIAHMRPARQAHWNGRHDAHDRDARRHLVAKAGHEVHQALKEAGHEIHNAAGEMSEEFNHAIDEVRGALFSEEEDDAPSVVEREEADGLPVRIVPGTRVTEAHAAPPAPPAPPRVVVSKRTKSGGKVVGATRPVAPVAIRTEAAEVPTIPGAISATPERADDAARVKLHEVITAWLDPDVPQSWSLPERELNDLVLEKSRETVEKGGVLGTMYITHLKLDTTPTHRDKLIKLYNRELVGHRLINLGGALTFILMCLAAVSGYIRADEATKGYYTNRLRMLAAAAVGAGGVLIYQMVT